MASASGVSNITGRVIFGSGGRSGPAATARSKAVAAPTAARSNDTVPIRGFIAHPFHARPAAARATARLSPSTAPR